jgi:hypothetical protein
MKSTLVCSLVLALAGAAHAGGIQLRVVDAESGKPIRGAAVERWASEWQPRILRPPGRFWFPGGRAATDAKGRAAIDKTARDDWYAIEAEGYEKGRVERAGSKFRFTPRAGSKPRELTAEAGVLVVPLKRLGANGGTPPPGPDAPPPRK